MGYIGSKPANNFETVRKQVSTSNSGTTITLDYPVTSVADIRLTINAVVQSYDNYSVSGSTLTVGGTLNNDRVEILFVGRTYGSIAPSDASIVTSALQDDAVTAAKLSSTAVDNTNTNSTLITAQTEKSSLVDADKFLISDSAASGALKYVQKSNLPSGDFVKLGTVATNNSNVTWLTIDNCFSSTYDLYRIVGYHSVTSGGSHNYFRWRTGGASGTSYTTSDYHWINRGYFISSSQPSGAYFNGNYASDHGRVASDIRSDSNSAYVTFDLLVSDPNTNVMSRGQVTGVSCVRQNTDQRWVSHHVGITNNANVNATGFEMTVSTGSINYGRVSVYGIKQA